MIMNRKQRREQEQFFKMIHDFLSQEYKNILDIINTQELANDLKLEKIKYYCDRQLIEIKKNYQNKIND